MVLVFTALDEQQKRINSLFSDEETLRKKAQNKQIFCPDCGNNLRFRSGTFRPHFYHAKNECTNPFSEPESEHHLKGKALLYKWLKSLYPKANVELEWKVSETNQRSDVMIKHDNGEKWAFEFQCTPISEGVWKERHDLYKKAGVHDFWIISSNINKYFTGNSQSFRLTRDLEKGIFSSNNHIYYLDVEKEHFHVVRGGEFATKTILRDEDTFFSLPMAETTITGMELWHREMVNYFADDAQIEKLSNNQILYKMAGDELDRIEKIRQEKVRHQQNVYFRLLVNKRNSEWGYLSKKEKIILKELFKKHNYSLENLPGFFFCDSSNHDVKTPIFLIQLWLYDQMIYNKSKYPSKKHGFPVLWSPDALKALNKLKKRGGYRVNKPKEPILWEEPDKPLINDIMEFWSSVGLLMPMGKSRFYYRILYDYLPPHSSLKDSIFFEWYSCPNSRDIPIPSEVIDSSRQYKF